MSKKYIWLIAPWALFVVLAVGWCVYWFMAAGAAQRGFEQWAQAQDAAGAEAHYHDVSAHGFPVMLRLDVRAAGYAPPGAAWTAVTERIDININLIDPAHVIVSAPEPITITHASGAVEIVSADALLVSFRTRSGDPRFGIEADAFRLDNPEAEGVFSAEKLVLTTRRDPRDAAHTQVSIDATNVTLARDVRAFEPFGREIARLRAAIVLEQAGALAPPLLSLDAWRDANGVARMEAIEVRWGPFSAMGQGTFALDAQRRAWGRLELNAPDAGPAAAALVQSPNLPASARPALSALQAGGGELLLDVDARDGVLYVEGQRVRDLAALY